MVGTLVSFWDGLFFRGYRECTSSWKITPAETPNPRSRALYLQRQRVFPSTSAVCHKKKAPGYLESWLVDKEIGMSLNMMISMISTLVPSMPSISNQFFVFLAELKNDAHLKKWFGFLDVPQFSGRKSFSPPKTKQALAELYFRQRRVPPNQLPIAKPGPS